MATWKIKIKEERNGVVVEREITALGCYFIDPRDNKLVWETSEGEEKVTHTRIRAVVEKRINPPPQSFHF